MKTRLSATSMQAKNYNAHQCLEKLSKLKDKLVTAAIVRMAGA